MTNDDNKEQLAQLQQVLEDTQAYILQAQQILRDLGVRDASKDGHVSKARSVGQLGVDEQNTVIEGVFDGQHMIGPDGKQYAVPANYASKSKLVEGDILKLTITADGSFLYKQIGPVERKRLLGVLVKDEEKNDYRVLAEGRSYRVLLASVTYFKGEGGDEAVILVPKDADSKWAAVENIVKNFSKSKQDQAVQMSEGAVPAAGTAPVMGAAAQPEMLKDGSEAELTDGSDGMLKGGKTKAGDDEEVLPPEQQGTPLEDLEL
ncbi:MAG: hypothetical protein A3F54_03045 [Candidatus Kerfeldbacteria bacterium RIFCSPHIGHO2_12_FULL_48_17]|uniref:50S ribosomal protein L7/L12 n=1 Tax=Candidatus Kerfeldbacteria bacterium RIFCSPHIGHO2_12_FULL_48_17 TaxID=1798542 RepID=A0A1G2B814_9BACT|nr:MAG: hypothetical protein A3F54_03045 [Candidatus Kerfeldbacteria bacterium RIFCSPHIGHO2_12_FULL_48_17]